MSSEPIGTAGLLAEARGSFRRLTPVYARREMNDGAALVVICRIPRSSETEPSPALCESRATRWSGDFEPGGDHCIPALAKRGRGSSCSATRAMPRASPRRRWSGWTTPPTSREASRPAGAESPSTPPSLGGERRPSARAPRRSPRSARGPSTEPRPCLSDRERGSRRAPLPRRSGTSRRSGTPYSRMKSANSIDATPFDRTMRGTRVDPWHPRAHHRDHHRPEPPDHEREDGQPDTRQRRAGHAALATSAPKEEVTVCRRAEALVELLERVQGAVLRDAERDAGREVAMKPLPIVILEIPQAMRPIPSA